MWIREPQLSIIRSNLQRGSSSPSLVWDIMQKCWNAGFRLALRAGFLVLLSGCGITSSKAPVPVGTGSATGATTLASTGLQLGYAWASDSGNLYPVLGVTGSAHYGAALFHEGSGTTAAAGVSSPDGAWALSVRADGTLQVFLLPAMSATTLTTGIPKDAQILFSPKGTSAAIVSPSAVTAVVITGLPAKPQVEAVGLPRGRALAGTAISDGGTLLTGLQQAGAGQIELGVTSANGSYAAVGSLGGWGGAAFVPGAVAGAAGESAVVADSASGQLTYLRNLGGATPASGQLNAGGLLQKAAAVGVSADGKWALVADAGKGQVVRVSLSDATAAPVALACACSPKSMMPTTTDGVFSLTVGATGQPMWFIDSRTSTPRTFFVPGIAGGTQMASTQTQASGVTR